MKIQILKWTGIGLLLRLILMPVTMHGQDLFFINYFPMMFVKKGIWDPYGFIRTNFSYFPATYYGPVLFIIMSTVNFIFIKLFNMTSLVKILEISGAMMGKNLMTIDYVAAFRNLGLFKNLFLMKTPYLIFDFLIGIILLRSALRQRLALTSYKLWMLNIVVLHSAYAVGQADLITTFFIIAALYTALEKRPYLTVILLGLGGATKPFPYILIFPACLLLGQDWKTKFNLFLTGVLVSVLPYLPFYLSSGSAIFNFFTAPGQILYTGIVKWIFLSLFVLLYSFIVINAVRDSQTTNPERRLIYYFITILFLTYATVAVRIRYLSYITPLLALIIPQHKKFGIFTLLILLIYAFWGLSEKDLQLGLFAPLDPAYFLNLPTIQEIIARGVNIELIYKIICRVSLLTFLAAGFWVWRIKLNDEKEMLKVKKIGN